MLAFGLGIVQPPGRHGDGASAATPRSPVYFRVPTKAKDGVPAPVLVVLHGMGGKGESTAQPWIQEAENQGWVVVAPTFNYGDWFDPNAVRADDLKFSRELATILGDLPTTVGRDVAPRAMLFGFSRGAQLAHRFALYYPERVQAVAAYAAGTYTLPDSELALNGKNVTLDLPFGVADLPRWLGRACNRVQLASVPFWIGVGETDNRVEDVPRSWDPYLGQTRVARAESFHRALERHHVPSALNKFPGVDHFLTPEVLANAAGFFEQAPALSARTSYLSVPDAVLGLLDLAS